MKRKSPRAWYAPTHGIDFAGTGDAGEVNQRPLKADRDEYPVSLIVRRDGQWVTKEIRRRLGFR